MYEYIIDIPIGGRLAKHIIELSKKQLNIIIFIQKFIIIIKVTKMLYILL